MNDVQYYVEYNAGKALKVIFCVKIKKPSEGSEGFLRKVFVVEV